jgi:hypothetical protein
VLIPPVPAKRIEQLSDDEIEGCLEWRQGEADPRIMRMMDGLPVDPDIYEMAERAGLVEQYRLISSREQPDILPVRGIHFGTVASPNMGQRPTFGPGSSILWESSTLTVALGARRPTTVPKWIPLLNLVCSLFCQGACGLGGQDWVGPHR